MDCKCGTSIINLYKNLLNAYCCRLLTPHNDVQRLLMHCGPYAIFHVGMPDPPNVPFHYDDKLELEGFIRILSDLEAARGFR